MRRGRRLGVDVGDVRIGVAVCDPDGLVATPLETVAAGPDAIGRLSALASEVDALELVVGLPVSLSGREGPAAAKVRVFARALADTVAPTVVRLFDERMSTMTADSLLREGGRSGRSRRSVIDQAAATVILQTALDTERTRGSAPGETI
ncbi:MULTISPECIES: Holliday junction resolvase RuvX [unclassified Aeromicrobium]|uniref:Holliday junction resolvase RuvX n=1 Tax=unclassified Aeromicrobium TaxID=2633570 RepID=UPI0006F95A83|nr:MULTISPECIES: Holliday junction resolvase RuvX [unclassified Aeromicrobium]RYY50302.1 MAG: Holliday junction resolvase RuvX [Actinomycetales bacterium]KQO38237.1 Holliday junction resolvase [Aeromicrobium sp. Leaf245]KQP24371.1 Holliday junction resolvase [Aeromicrobium sp. Leaf272]KQP76121.1 Holliday junction resolvase [Aeromicrobium sp. Leaf289]KQP80794.1 Holliday junction resolvase [Aeromicrobium sp. Leaf291]